METYEMLERALSLIEDEENWSGSGYGENGQRCALHALDSVGYAGYYASLGPILGPQERLFHRARHRKNYLERQAAK